MRLEDYLAKKEYPYFNEYYQFLFGFKKLNEEISDETFQNLKSVGDKLGIRVHRSETIFGYLKKAGKGINKLFPLISDYLYTDLTGGKERKEIQVKMKKVLDQVDRKEIAAFLAQLDKGTIGLSSHIRHLLQSLFGLEISFYYEWKTDREYVLSEIEKIIVVLGKSGHDKEIEVMKKFKKWIMNKWVS